MITYSSSPARSELGAVYMPALRVSPQLSTGFHFTIGNVWLIHCGCIYTLLIQNASASRKKVYSCCLDSSHLGFAKLPSCQMTWKRQRWGSSYSSRNLATKESIVRKLMWHLICSHLYIKKYAEKDR